MCARESRARESCIVYWLKEQISTKLIIPEIKSALSENGALPLAGRTQGQQFTRPPSAFLSLVEIWALGVRAAGRIPRLSASLWAGSGHGRGVIDP